MLPDNQELKAAVLNIKKTFRNKRLLAKPSIYKNQLERLCLMKKRKDTMKKAVF